MTSYRYLGYGVTDSNGVAHLDHDPQGNPINGYTGTGSGEVDVIASTDNPITSSSIVSETYPVIDTVLYDIATTGKHDTTKWTILGTSTIGTNDTGTSISGTWGYKSNILLTGDFKIEFEASFNGNGRYGVTTSSNNDAVVFIGSNINWRYYQFSRVNGVFSAKVSDDGINWSNTNLDTTTVTTEDVYFIFRVISSERNISYRNLKIYPI